VRFRQPLIINRRGAVAYNEYTGRLEPATSQALTIMASIHPLAGKQVLNLPEGRRDSGGYVLYTTALLELPTKGKLGDTLSIHGDQYEVLAVEHWGNDLLPHNRYYCGRLTA